MIKSILLSMTTSGTAWHIRSADAEDDYFNPD